MDTVLVVNADLGLLHRVSLRHALRMLLRRAAEIHEAEPDRIGRLPGAEDRAPRAPRRHQVAVLGRPGLVRAGVLARDGRRCGYCGAVASTIDHILPRSRGGPNTWANTVAACPACNQHKGDRTPSEARMPLRTVPAVPTWGSLTAR